MSADIHRLSAAEIARGVKDGKHSATEVAEAFLLRIRRFDAKLRCFLAVLEDAARAQARAVDAKRGRGETLGPLAGVPVALKDNLQLLGAPTTCASRILEGYTAPYDATVTVRLKAADAVILGKTNLDEFAMGSSTENSAYFKTANPWDLSKVPGGSSGGSTAAVAGGLCAAALGSDTGGSIRQPASFCGVVGLKPTYGRVSRYGLVAFASSLDQIGPLTRTVEDSALMMAAIAGPDPRDSTCADRPVPDFSRVLAEGIRGLRVGLPREYFIAGTDPEVDRAVRSGVDLLKRMGAEIREVSLPHSKYAVSAYYVIAPSEASSNLARFDGIRYGARSQDGADLLDAYEATRGVGFGAEVKRRIMLGTYALSAGYYDAYYAKAQRVRTLVRGDFAEAFREVDLIATPTAPTAAFGIGEKSSDPLAMYLSDVFTIPSNLAGIPGISVPCAMSARGLPIGLQFMAPAFREELLIRAAAVLERERPFPAPWDREAGWAAA